MTTARSVRVRGVVQGVGFRPFVFRLARANALAGWVRNGGDGVEMHLEGTPRALDAFLRDLEARPPAAACIAGVDVRTVEPGGLNELASLNEVLARIIKRGNRSTDRRSRLRIGFPARSIASSRRSRTRRSPRST